MWQEKGINDADDKWTTSGPCNSTSLECWFGRGYKQLTWAQNLGHVDFETMLWMTTDGDVWLVMRRLEIDETRANFEYYPLKSTRV